MAAQSETPSTEPLLDGQPRFIPRYPGLGLFPKQPEKYPKTHYAATATSVAATFTLLGIATIELAANHNLGVAAGMYLFAAVAIVTTIVLLSLLYDRTKSLAFQNKKELDGSPESRKLERLKSSTIMSMLSGLTAGVSAIMTYSATTIYADQAKNAFITGGIFFGIAALMFYAGLRKLMNDPEPKDERYSSYAWDSLKVV